MLSFVTWPLAAACAAAGVAQAGAQGPSVSEQYLFAAANAERVQKHLPPLRWDSALRIAAAAHCAQMAARENIAHQYAGEAELAERGKIAGARFSIISENVAEAQTAVIIHDAWMQSAGHRHNLLDPQVDAVGIAVIRRNGQLYAVQDFERSVTPLTIVEQEQAVRQSIERTSPVRLLPPGDDARRTCALATGWSGARQPWFIVRYTAADLAQLPATLVEKLGTGKYHQAAVGACEASAGEPFSSFNIAVLLYP